VLLPRSASHAIPHFPRKKIACIFGIVSKTLSLSQKPEKMRIVQEIVPLLLKSWLLFRQNKLARFRRVIVVPAIPVRLLPLVNLIYLRSQAQKTRITFMLLRSQISDHFYFYFFVPFCFILLLDLACDLVNIQHIH
jgi:hypothetical protein